jgi:hypothetical protein
MTKGELKVNNLIDTIDAALATLPAPMLSRSGSVFYSGRGAFSRPGRLYILGLNPGGSPQVQAGNTIGKDIAAWTDMPEHYSRYLDESWEDKAPGTCGMQPRMRHMFGKLGMDLRRVPASNLVFVRSNNEASLAAEKGPLMAQCWPVHAAVIEVLGIETILALGGTAGRWVREAIGADRLIGSYSETNNRGWTSEAHIAPNGRAVITVTHPARTNWPNPDSDPTELVREVLNR